MTDTALIERNRPTTQAGPAGAATPATGPSTGRSPAVTENLPGSADYADDKIRLQVRPAESRVEVTAVADGCTATIDMTVMGAQRLSTMLDHAIVVAITRGLK